MYLSQDENKKKQIAVLDLTSKRLRSDTVRVLIDKIRLQYFHPPY